MKKKLINILIFTLMFIPVISVSAEDCYYKCDYSTATGSQRCYYVTECTTVVGSTSCTKVDFSYCGIYNNYTSETLSCGGDMLTGIPTAIPKVVSIFYNIIQVGVPIILIIIGMIDLVKSITAQKEDEIKKCQQIFLKRLIYAAVVFFVFVIVKFVISLVADGNSSRILDCAECFINNDCK